MKFILNLFTCLILISGCSSEHTHPANIDVTLSENETLFKGRFVEEPFVLPNAKFKDTNGNVITWPSNDMPADVTVIFFGYTNCADGYCNTQTANVAAAIRGLPQAQQERVNFVFITTDPPRDTPAVLRTYLDLHNSRFIGLRASIDVTQKAGLALGVHVDDLPDPIPTFNYEVGHGLQLFAFLPNGTSPVFWMEDNTVQEIRQDLQTLLGKRWQKQG
jgi:protein SCO1/2